RGALVVGPSGSAELAAAGARLVLPDDRNAQGVWALPGPSLEALRDAGALLPEGFPAAVPEGARRAEIDLADAPSGDDADLELAPGAATRVAVEVTHTGSGSAWVDDGSWALPGVVRLGVRWWTTNGEMVRDDTRAPLGAWMWPGDRTTVDVPLEAVDRLGQPLPPGRYLVDVDVVQEGFAWFSAEGAPPLRLVVEVRERAGR
ncbi:MAG TPA: hypothetical protein VK866_04830, partial [Acidimicrobiales bacterium]|nr:hypothetical protein [Acidimicrobiales bacterium]